MVETSLSISIAALVVTIVLGTLPVKGWIYHLAPWLWPRLPADKASNLESGLRGEAFAELYQELSDLTRRLEKLEARNRLAGEASNYLNPFSRGFRLGRMLDPSNITNWFVSFWQTRAA